jgi:parallel beta-helix repeat protein
MKERHAFSVVSICLSALLLPLSAFSQGSLTPPGSPAPTLKTLQQVEPRTDLQVLYTQNHDGVSDDTTAEIVIAQPGSYYMSQNLAVTRNIGILVSTAGVTIDLNGFRISGLGSGTGISFTADWETLRNGSISGFTIGVSVSAVNACSFRDLVISSIGTNGINASSANACSFRDVVVSDSSSSGISAGSNSLVESCRVHDCTGGSGIVTGSGARLKGCVVSDSTVTSGFFLGSGSSAADCTASTNTSTDNFSSGFTSNGLGLNLTNCVAYAMNSTNATLSGTTGAGFLLPAGSTLRGCMSHANKADGFNLLGITGQTLSMGRATLIDCISTSNGGDGIKTTIATTIANCTVTENGGDGIEATTGNTIHDCTIRSNQGNGILVTDACLISGCVVNESGKKTGAPTNTAADGIEMGSRNRVVNCTIFNGAQFGINATSTSNRNFIEGCLVNSNDAGGISLQANTNTVIKNQVVGNITFNINQTGGGIAPIQNASDAVGTIHPLANFQ